MFIPFTPHKVLIKGKAVHATVIAMDTEISIEKCFSREKTDQKKLEDVDNKISIANDEEVDEKEIGDKLVEVAKITICVINHKNHKYEWYDATEVEPLEPTELTLPKQM